MTWPIATLLYKVDYVVTAVKNIFSSLFSYTSFMVCNLWLGLGLVVALEMVQNFCLRLGW